MRIRTCVDVVIPVFNGCETIQAAIASVLAQEGAWIHRIIVVDDGSTDNTFEVVQSLDCPQIELVQTPNRGVASARNLGIEKSTADWVAFLDADDLWVPGKLSAQMAAAKSHGVGFVCGSVSLRSPMPSGNISVKALANGNFVSTSSVIVKRDVLQRILPVFRPGMSFAEDYLAWLKCLTLTPGYYISDKLVDYMLSDWPRYRWAQIVRNIAALNFWYACFLRQIGKTPSQRLSIAFLVFIGSVRSLLSILKRFSLSRAQVRFNKHEE